MQLTLHIHSLPIGAFAACTGTEMPKPDPWDSHGKQVSGTPKTSTPSYSSDLRLECGFNPHHHTAWYPCTNPQTDKPVFKYRWSGIERISTTPMYTWPSPLCLLCLHRLHCLLGCRFSCCLCCFLCHSMSTRELDKDVGVVRQSLDTSF